MNIVILTVILSFLSLMTSNPYGHLIGRNAPRLKDVIGKREVRPRHKDTEEKGLHERYARGYDFVTEVYSSYDSMGGSGGLVDYQYEDPTVVDDAPSSPASSCVDPPINDLRRCVDTIPGNVPIESERTLEDDLIHRFNFSIYAAEATSTHLEIDLESGEHALSERTLCPWENKINSNINRYPVDIVYAQCQCRNCIDPDIHELSLTNLCRPVVSWRAVLNRGPCVNGTYQYVEESIPVPVACVCDRRIISP